MLQAARSGRWPIHKGGSTPRYTTVMQPDFSSHRFVKASQSLDMSCSKETQSSNRLDLRGEFVPKITVQWIFVPDQGNESPIVHPVPYLDPLDLLGEASATDTAEELSMNHSHALISNNNVVATAYESLFNSLPVSGFAPNAGFVQQRGYETSNQCPTTQFPGTNKPSDPVLCTPLTLPGIQLAEQFQENTLFSTPLPYATNEAFYSQLGSSLGESRHEVLAPFPLLSPSYLDGGLDLTVQADPSILTLVSEPTLPEIDIQGNINPAIALSNQISWQDSIETLGGDIYIDLSHQNDALLHHSHENVNIFSMSQISFNHDQNSLMLDLVDSVEDHFSETPRPQILDKTMSSESSLCSPLLGPATQLDKTGHLCSNRKRVLQVGKVSRPARPIESPLSCFETLKSRSYVNPEDGKIQGEMSVWVGPKQSDRGKKRIKGIEACFRCRRLKRKVSLPIGTHS
jgi:hypothetical protein